MQPHTRYTQHSPRFPCCMIVHPPSPLIALPLSLASLNEAAFQAVPPARWPPAHLTHRPLHSKALLAELGCLDGCSKWEE
ncbi:hypothetical protein CBOM_08114 [Ceraceosorus bombacis]|uniref:Uncharacterized protein n=1 Tax=Ceraceosorus bombacis TaxID=401625 RepID=A0A0P1BA42_9BASI|nr:hypothetical protein CBOM_08114 [Ceraceosorus bombacis]